MLFATIILAQLTLAKNVPANRFSKIDLRKELEATSEASLFDRFVRGSMVSLIGDF